MGPEPPDPPSPDAIQVGAPRLEPDAPQRTDRPHFDDESSRTAVSRSEAFFGREVRARTARPIWGALFLMIAVAVLAASWQWGNPRVAGALAPPCLLIAYAFLRPLILPLRYRFSEDGIQVNRPRRDVKYGDIQEVYRGARYKKGVFPIDLLLQDDCIRIPARLNVSSAELLEFLDTQPLGPRPLDEVPQRFDKFLKQQMLLAAAEDIYVFRGSRRRISPRTRFHRSVAWHLVLLATFWFVLTSFDSAVPLYPSLGALTSVFALVFLLAGYTRLRYGHVRIKNVKDALLIVTPFAIALQQGDLRGELRWEELVSVWRGTQLSTSADLNSLTLKVRGASIVLADVYQWPLDLVSHLLDQYARK